MSAAEPTQDRNTETDTGAAGNDTRPSRQEALRWLLLGLLVAAGLITLIWWLMIAFSLALLLLWVPAVLLAGALVAAAWQWS